MSNKRTRRTTLEDMIKCPHCHAFSYPRLFSNPQNEDEKEAVICGSCHQNLRPYMKAVEEYQKKLQERILNETPNEDNALIMEGDNGETEAYIDSDKIVDEMLTPALNKGIIKEDSNKES